uniref:Uncharacterized protein n=1 Tax=Salarias fasciatus TaxID=181472 RepID=A0A672H042_SALFA
NRLRPKRHYLLAAARSSFCERCTDTNTLIQHQRLPSTVTPSLWLICLFAPWIQEDFTPSRATCYILKRFRFSHKRNAAC